MEAYPSDPYAYASGGGDWKDRFHNIEGVLPLILLIVIAFFVLQFLNIIPCIIPIGCGGEINVGVIGIPTPDVENVLTSQEARFKGINYGVNLPPNYITGDALKSFSIIILQGEPAFDMTVREAIKSWVDGGGKLIVVGDAGSKHPLYANVAGWSWPSGNGLPVPAQLTGEWINLPDVSYGLNLRFADFNHPIVVGLQKVGAQLQRPEVVHKVMPKGGKMIVAIDTNEGTYPAVIEGGSGLGTVMYYAYDPGQTPAMFLATLEYLGG